MSRTRRHTLTDLQVRDMRVLYTSTYDLPQRDERKWTMRRLADKYKTSYQTVYKIVNYKTYEWVE